MFVPTIECIFIHIPKTAGMTIFETILKLDRPFGWFLGVDKKETLHEMTEGSTLLGHISYKAALTSKKMNRDYWKRSFKFTFVRNPYDRLVSLYEYHRISKVLKLTFDAFVYELYHSDVPEVGLYNVKNFAKNSVLYHKSVFGNQYNPMVDWIPDDIGFIGRLEFFEEDMNHLLCILGYEGKPESFARKNYSTHATYLDYYKNPDTISYVNKMYDKDFKRFGYKLM